MYDSDICLIFISILKFVCNHLLKDCLLYVKFLTPKENFMKFDLILLCRSIIRSYFSDLKILIVFFKFFCR